MPATGSEARKRPLGGVHLRGVIAQIYWVYHFAAALHGFTVRRDRKTGQWTLRATVVSSDIFRLRQRPLKLIIPLDNGKRRWQWQVDSFDIDQGTITAMLSHFEGELRP